MQGLSLCPGADSGVGINRVPVGGILPVFTPLGKQRKQKRVEGEAGLQDWGAQPSEGEAGGLRASWNTGDVSHQGNFPSLCP